MLASTSLRKESIEGIVTTPYCFVTGHLTIWLNAMLQAEELPASVADLHTGLTKMKAKCFTHADWLLG
jgi:hypothetical protein